MAASRVDPRIAAPEVRWGAVPRPRLLPAFGGTPATRLVVLVAPSGYGKTTLLEQWAQRDRRPQVRLVLGPETAAPLALLDAISRRLRPLQGSQAPIALVLDRAEVLGPRCADPLLMVAESLPAGSVLAVASSREPPLPIGRLRLEGRLVELRTADLAMTPAEGQGLLQRAGVLLDADQLGTVMRVTEGWPAGIALAALALRHAESRPAALAAFDGADHVVSEYLNDVFLDALSGAERDLLVRTSVFAQLTGPLCDAVTGRQGCGNVLRELDRANVLIERVDRCDRTFRVHPLLRACLRAELSRSGALAERRAHLRAATWLAQDGAPALAAEQAVCGGDVRRAGQLLWPAARAAALRGGSRDVARVLERLTAAQIEAEPTLALSRAACDLGRRVREDVEHWLDAAERAGRDDPAAHLEAEIAVLRAIVARDGVAEMARQARRARALAASGTAWHGLACFLDGAAHHLVGEEADACEPLAAGARAAAVGAPLVAVLCHGLLARITLQAERWDAGRREAEDARAAAQAHGLEHHPAAALAFAASALAGAQDGHIEQARRDAQAAGRLAPLPSAFAPWLAAETYVLLARTHLRLSDSAGAREALGAAGRLVRAWPQATAVRAAIDDAWERVDRFAASAVVGETTLTTAELRVLRMLPSHLTLGEIAARLHVSPNTVKTQANAVYRKLGASSRSQAVACALAVGLIDH
jgi:LuxR family maltose regulon positive regulatory protein